MTFDESLHPRGVHGKWAKKLSDKIGLDMQSGKDYTPAGSLKVQSKEVKFLRSRSASVVKAQWPNSMSPARKKQIHDVITAQSKKSIHIRMGENALAGILDDKRFKNIHEHAAGTKSDKYLKLRTEIENQVMGLKKAPASKRPIYGYVGDVNDVTMYGGYAVTLKDSVRVRTTTSMGDSLNDGLDVHPIEAVPSLSFDHLKGMTGMNNARSLKANGTIHGLSYMEAQVHGGLGIGDIASVTVPRYAPQDLIARLKALGITVNFEADKTPDQLKRGV